MSSSKDNTNRGGHKKKLKPPRPTSGLQNENTVVKGDPRSPAERRAAGRNGHRNKNP